MAKSFGSSNVLGGSDHVEVVRDQFGQRAGIAQSQDVQQSECRENDPQRYRHVVRSAYVEGVESKMFLVL